MNALDIVLLIAVILIIAGSIALNVKRKKKGCCGECCNCDKKCKTNQ